MDDFATENALDLLNSMATITRSVLRLTPLVIRFYTTDDPQVSSITGDLFDLWRTGLSTFVKVLLASDDSSMLLVRGDVRPYRGASCKPAFRSRSSVVGGANVTVAQHTKGRGESDNAMPDASVSGLAIFWMLLHAVAACPRIPRTATANVVN